MVWWKKAILGLALFILPVAAWIGYRAAGGTCTCRPACTCPPPCGCTNHLGR